LGEGGKENMQEPHVVRFLRSGGTLNDLLTSRGIVAKRHRKHDNVVLLKYNQIESPMGDPIVQECRGIVLDEADDWRVVARAFSKFFNYGEGHAAPIDWPTASVQEKVDGSMIAVYAYKGAWHAATTGTPDGAGNVHGIDTSGTWNPRPGAIAAMPQTFADYFWQTLSLYDAGPLLAPPMSPFDDWTYIFELTGPLNRIVVPHFEAKLTVLGARDPATGLWMTPDEAAAMIGNVPAVRSRCNRWTTS